MNPEYLIPHQIAHNTETGIDPSLAERREKRRTLVSRVFVLKSASQENVKDRIAKGSPLEELNFVVNVMGLKGKKEGVKNPDQIMPLGGVVKKMRGEPMWKGESLSAGTERELFEEGYIRSPEYHFSAGNNICTTGHQSSRSCHTRASPFDDFHQMNPEEDKFAAYIPLDVEQTKGLFEHGAIPLPAHEARLVDSLNVTGLAQEGGGRTRTII